MSEDGRTRIAIVGAGIVGLSLAVTLNAFDTEQKFVIDMYESAPELSEIGAGINVWPRTWQILKEIGMEETLEPLFDHRPDLERRVVFEARKADQRTGFKVVDVMKDGGVLRIHRADFQRSLLKHLPVAGSSTKINTTCTLHLSHRLVDYGPTPSSSSAQHSGPVTLYFTDKPCAIIDHLILVPCIRQPTKWPLQRLNHLDLYAEGRVILIGDAAHAMVPHQGAGAGVGIEYMGKEKHAVVYPISGGKLINIVATVHDRSKEGTVYEGTGNQEVTQSEFFSHFSGWEEEFQALLRCIRQPTKWPLQRLNHLDLYAEGRVILIGDAAHAMVPHQGAGAGVGIEDAYILASLLTQTSESHPLPMQRISHLVDVYNTVRVPLATSFAKASINQGRYYGLEAPGFEHIKEGDDVPRDKLTALLRLADDNWSWTTSNPESDKKRAMELLQESRAHL
ncbi:Salicylate hydroxylase [Leucoagaricus sp. SymC.cos]|nr:Salicylate hydroxylase [Leucoagaricus sp. SymC.cos]